MNDKLTDEQSGLDAIYPQRALASDPAPDSPREGLFKLHNELSTKALAIMRLKNQDYGMVNDHLANFRRHGSFGICVRLSDKLARLESFVEKGFNAVQDESVEDTIVDAMNYLVLLMAMIRDERRA